MADHDYTATCHTEGCGNAGIPIPMTWSDEFGPPTGVYCGPCGVEVTDISGDITGGEVEE